MPRSETALTVHHIDRTARRSGLSLPLPISLAELSRVELQERRVSEASLHALWESAVNELGDPSFPLRCAEFPFEETRSVVLLACASKPTIGEALAAALRYGCLATDDLVWQVEVRGAEVVIAAAAAAPGVGARCVHEFHVIDAIRTARAVTGGAFEPREVRFSHQPAATLSEYEAVLGVPVTFGAERVEIRMTHASLATPIAERTPAYVACFFEATVEAMLARYAAQAHGAKHETLVERVRAFIESELEGGEATLEHGARVLAMSERSLHRHLAAQGTSFRELLDQTRRVRAMELLGDPGASADLGPIAAALGFSDVRAFARAFKRWTGRTPRSLLPCAA